MQTIAAPISDICKRLAEIDGQQRHEQSASHALVSQRILVASAKTAYAATKKEVPEIVTEVGFHYPA